MWFGTESCLSFLEFHPKPEMFHLPFTVLCLAAQQQGGPRGMVTSGHKQLCSCGHLHMVMMALGFPGGSSNKESACNAGDLGWISGWGRSPGGGHGNPLQCSGLENPMDRGGWRATVHGVTQVRHDWAAEKSAAHDGMFLPCVCVCVRSVMSDSLVTPWTIARQAPLSMEFSQQEYWSKKIIKSWSKLPFPSLGDLPNPGIEPMSLASPAFTGKFFTSWTSRKPTSFL